ncbi:hypothetical protein NDU88_002619 [Pleurodeles waltl]|uniref:Uncharacterized protein n=1 Tax=Pleurodeles waltl TaxID=8319 RepID=A0AAV7VEW9_PLEWA|nr:hypothetical protein NDU88_002619 [Pleurodeles waltl]
MWARPKRPAVRAQSRQTDPRRGRPGPAANVRAGRPQGPPEPGPPACRVVVRSATPQRPRGVQIPRARLRRLQDSPAGTVGPGAHATAKDASRPLAQKPSPSLFLLGWRRLLTAHRQSGSPVPGPLDPRGLRAAPQTSQPRSHPGPAALVP